MRVLTTRHNAGAFNFALLLLRLTFGILIAHHGYEKLMQFSQLQYSFMNFLGLGSKISLCLTIFAELFCGILVAIGLLTRLATVPLIIAMAIAFFMVMKHDALGHGEVALLYLVAFLALFITGAGRISLDAVISK